MKKILKIITIAMVSAIIGFGVGIWETNRYFNTRQLLTYLKCMELAEKERIERNSLIGALFNFSRASAFNPEEPMVYKEIGKLSEELGDDAFAIRCYKLAINSDKYPEGEGKQRLKAKISLLESKLNQAE